MRLVIAAIGKLKDDGETVLVGRYRERIAAIGPSLGFQDIVIHETAESKKPNPGQRKEEEAQALLKGIEPAAALVALDERGSNLTSEAFSKTMTQLRDDGIASLRFVIGGPDGLDPDIQKKARLTLSLSPMTLPHGLARVVLLEQIYRALTIAAGHPYHRA